MILAVDKNKDILDCYKDFYQELNISFIEFNDDVAAYNFFVKTQKNFKMITTGLHFNDKNEGLDFARNIKKISSVPIVLITGAGLITSIEDSLFAAILFKPISFAHLADCLTRYTDLLLKPTILTARENKIR